MDFTKGFAIAVAESCEIELVVFLRSFHFPDWKMQFGAYTYPFHNQKCTVQKMKQNDLLLYEIKTNDNTGIGDIMEVSGFTVLIDQIRDHAGIKYIREGSVE